MQKKIIKNSGKNGYRVYSAKSEFVDVEAETASEAAQKSGIAKPVKIEKIGLKLKYILRDDELESENLAFAQKEAQFVSLDELSSVVGTSSSPQMQVEAATHANDYKDAALKNNTDKLDIEA